MRAPGDEDARALNRRLVRDTPRELVMPSSRLDSTATVFLKNDESDPHPGSHFFVAKTQKIDSHFSLKGILTSKLILTFHFFKNICSLFLVHGDFRVELLRLLARKKRLVHGVLAQLRQVALELRHVVAPRVLAHLVERARDRAVLFIYFERPKKCGRAGNTFF